MKGYSKIFSLESFHVFIYVYASLKYGESQKKKLLNNANNTNQSKAIILMVLRIILTIPITLLVYLIMFIFATYYEIINIILKKTHGSAYLGLLEGTDIVWALDDQSRSIVNSIFIVELKDNQTIADLKQFFCDKFSQICGTHSKMGCTRAEKYGFGYFLKAKIDISEFINYMDDYSNEDELKLLFDQYSNSPLPINDTALWRIHVGKTPIVWSKGNSKKRLHPVMIQYHHCVGDGISIISMMTVNLLKNGVDIMKNKCSDLQEAMEKRRKLNAKPKNTNVCSRIGEVVRNVWEKEAYIKFCGPMTKPETNLLHGATLSGNKHLIWSLEQLGGDYINKVKGIKNCFPGVSFSDVMLAAVSASFAEYYKKHQKVIPESIRASLTAYITSADFNKLITYKNGIPIANLDNSFSLGVLEMPIADDDIKNNLIARLKNISKESQLLRGALDFPFIYWQLKVVSTFLTIPILRLSVESNDATMVVTNIPGNLKNTLISGNEIVDSITWAPNFGKVGCTVSIFSYDDLFRIGIQMDKTLIENREEVQFLADRVFYFIDLLSEATRNMKK